MGIWAVIWLVFPVWAITHGTYLAIRRMENQGMHFPRPFRILVLTIASIPLFMFVAILLLILLGMVYMQITGQFATEM